MKKFLITICIAAGMQFSYAQQAVDNELPQRFFNEARSMFQDKNYVGAEHSLKQFLKQSTDRTLLAEANYMLVASAFFRGNTDADLKLKEFLDNYPETYHRNDVNFYVGSIHFDKKEWEKALFWLEQADVNYLNLPDQEDYSLRLAYANLQMKRYDKAEQTFVLLNKNSKKYNEPAAYYLAYIDFRKGNYDKSLSMFEQLKNKPEYREEALFFLTQGHFIKNDLNRAVSEGEDYLRSYPRSKNSKEIYRILGNSYHRLHDVNSSISNYEKYLQLEKSPIAEDMYMLGTSYIQAANYKAAIDVLKHAASTNNKLGQSAYMQLGQAYLKLNDSANALMSFDAASRSKFDPTVSESALYNYALLVHQTSLSVFDQSITALQRFLKEYPNSKYATQVNEILASTFLSTKNYNAALSAINEIKNPGRQILQAKQIIYFRIGTQDFINTNYVSALSNFNNCINMGSYDSKTRNESYFWKGEIIYREGNYQLAASNYQTYVSGASSSDANYGLALYNLGYSNFKVKNYSGALQSFQRYVATERDRTLPTYSDALNRIGDCYLYNRNFAEAERFYAQAVSSNSSSADYSEFQKAFVMGLRRNYNGKISALDQMMARFPDSDYLDDALYEKSRAQVMLNRERDAISTLEKLLKDYPESPLNQKAGVQLGQLYFNTNNLKKSVEAYKRVIGKYPNTEEANMSIKSLETVYKEMNDIKSYASYVNSLGSGTIITASRQDSLSFLAAENIYMKGQKNLSTNAMNNYLKSYPNGAFSGDAHYFLGYIAFEDKNIDTALNEFNQVIKLNNRKYKDDALIYVSGIYFDKKDYESAYEAYSQLNNSATSSDNKNVAQLGMLRSASLLNKDKEVVSAATALLTNTKLSPEISTEARYLRAKSNIKLKQTDNAATDLQTLALDSRNIHGAEAQYILADMYLKWESYDKAISQVQSFMKQGTPHEYWMAKALIVLSDSYAAKGDAFQAKLYLENLQANYKGSETDIVDAINERLK